MKIINTNSTYRVYPDDLKTFDSLPVGVYKACFSKFTGFFLEKHPDVEIKEKIYGHHKEKVAKILSSFEKFDRNLGVIFSGDKGIGKSMAAKLMTQTSLEKGIPVILVNEYLPGISDLLNDIEQEVVVIFDEFDKTYESSSGRCGDRDSCEDDRQTECLTLLDGFGVGKKLYVITCNNIRKLNDFLVNRPGRFHYHIIFTYPTEEEIREYLTDKLDKAYYGEIDNVIAFSKRVDLNYDCLRAIAFELNNGLKFADAIGDLNIINSERDAEKYNIIISLSDGSKMVVKRYYMDNYNTDEVSLRASTDKYRVRIWFTPAEDIAYDMQRATYALNLDTVDRDGWELEVKKCSEDSKNPCFQYVDEDESGWPVHVVDVTFQRIVDRKDTYHYAF